MPLSGSSRSSFAIVLPEPTMAGIPQEPVTRGGIGPYFKHQSAYVTEKIDAHGRSSKVEAVKLRFFFHKLQFFQMYQITKTTKLVLKRDQHLDSQNTSPKPQSEFRVKIF